MNEEVADGPAEDESGGSARESGDDILKAALARGLTYRSAGALAGVSQRTVARRMEDSVFARDVAKARAEYVTVVTGQLMAMGPEALEVLRGCLQEDRAADRRQAAVDILRLGLHYRHQGDLEAEVAELRLRLDAQDAR